MILDDIKEKIDWRNRVLEYYFSYFIENWNEVIYIHDKKVKNIAEWNLLHDIINPHKWIKNITIYYSPILHGCMHTIKVRAKFKNLRILLDIGWGYTIIVRRPVEK